MPASRSSSVRGGRVVNAQALLGLAAFVGVFTFAGYGVLGALAGHRSWRQLPHDLGLAYLLGIASLGSLLTLQVVIGVPLSLALDPRLRHPSSASVGLVVGRRRVVDEPPTASVDHTCRVRGRQHASSC